MKSYRDVVSSSPIVSPVCIAELVKEAIKTEVRSKNVILYGVREDQDIDDIESRTEKPSMIFSAPLGRSPISVSAPISFWGRKIAVKNPPHQNVCLSTSDAAVLSASAEKCRTSCSQVQLLDLLNLYDKTNFLYQIV